jgi:hypothetical protein
VESKSTHLQKLAPCPMALFLERVHIVGQESLEAEDGAFFAGEPGTFVELLCEREASRAESRAQWRVRDAADEDGGRVGGW